MNQTHCPHCGQPYVVRPEQWAQYHGRTINCTRCGLPFTVTAPPEALPPLSGAPAPGQTAASASQMQSPALGVYPPELYAPLPVQGNGWAVCSLISGLLMCVPLLAGLIAVITGSIGLARTRNPRVGGRGMSIAGLILGALSLLVVTPLMIVAILPYSREQAQRAKCQANMTRIGQALTAYAQSNNGQFPDHLEDVLHLDPALDRGIFVCPDDDKLPPDAASAQKAAHQISSWTNCSYHYVGNDVTLSDDVSKIVLLYEPLTNHHGKGMNVLTADGQVQWIGPIEAKQIIAQQRSGTRPIRINTSNDGNLGP